MKVYRLTTNFVETVTKRSLGVQCKKWMERETLLCYYFGTFGIQNKSYKLQQVKVL